LHDIGKVGIRDSILQKPGKLTTEEFSHMKMHTVIGADTLLMVHKRFPGNEFISMGVDIARSHHEWWNGSGYPDGLVETQIPVSARIVSLVDVYDALRSKRHYKERLGNKETCETIISGSGSQFDPDIVEAFTKLIDKFEAITRSLQDTPL